MTVMAFVAHPDDEIIGIGGTLAKLSQEEDVVVVVFSYGQGWPFWLPEREVIRRRVHEVQKAGDIIGVKKTVFLGLGDTKISEQFDEKKFRNLKKLFQEVNPDKVFYHSIQDGHNDHRFVNKVVEELISRTDVERYTFEINLWNWFQHKSPVILFDVTETWKKKIRAMNQFKSQSLFINILRPIVTLKSHYYGRRYGYKYVEVFYKR
jgi:LmbE family N-acetylglucosaminyl deacetylase